MTQADGGAQAGRESDAVLIAAGVADLALSGIGAALRGVRGLLGRSDLAELAQDGQQEMRERGRLAIQRYTSVPEPHMELLARRVAARRGRSDVSEDA
ncbi:polyprenyl synthetase [Streptomyces sp. NPDC020898]|uniref:polyprenyl synthetase n=1 Tax=Streptomyces sp. NPDC020898 TaxID=3365101 RepID=UPI0037BAD39D